MIKTIDFEIIYTQNPQISQRGYVEVPADADEDVEWFYYDQSGMSVPREFTHHDGIGISQIGATKEQIREIDRFLNEVNFEFVDFVTDVICQSEEDDCKTYKKGNIIVKINGGAKFEVKVSDYDGDWDSQYYLKFRLFYNEKQVNLNDDIYFEDPFTYDEFSVDNEILCENGAYIIEVPKTYFDGEDDTISNDEIIKEYANAFETAYKKSLVKEWGVFGIAYDFIGEQFKESVEKFNDSCEKSEFADAVEDDFIDNYSLDELCILTVDDIKKIIKEDYEYNQSLMEDCARDYEEQCRLQIEEYFGDL